MACPLAEYSVVRWSGVSSKPVYEEIAHSTKIWGNPENSDHECFHFFLMECESLFLFFSEGFFKEGICDKKPIKGEIRDVWSLFVDFINIFFKNTHLDEVLWGVLKDAVPEKQLLWFLRKKF